MTGPGPDRELLRQLLAAYCDGHPQAALLRLAAAIDDVRLARLLEAEGPELLAAVDPDRLARALGRRGAEGDGRSSAPPTPAEQQKPVAVFEVQLLGIPRVVRLPAPNGEAVDASTVSSSESAGVELTWSLRRALELFAFLASSPERRASREEMIEACWPRDESGAVQRNFHPTLSHLRRALGGGGHHVAPFLLLENGVYRLNPRYRWRVDSRRLAVLADRATRYRQGGETGAAMAAWEEAWRLYRGPFLEGYYGSWVVEHRERLSDLYLRVLRQLGAAYAERDELEQALDAYRTVLLTDPLEERVHLEVLRIYARQGRRDLVRRQYDRLTGLLRRELGVEPMAETAAEYHRLMR